MNIVKEYLKPENKLVDEVVAWLCGDDGYKGRLKNIAGTIVAA